MKKQYSKPTLISEVLIKEDVLIKSMETDNRLVNSKSIIPDSFRIDDIL